MGRTTTLAGIGSIAFGVLTIAAFGVVNPPGGAYKVSQAADYVSKGHRAAAFAGGYLALLSVLGLIALLTHLRAVLGRVAADTRAPHLFWATGLAAVASIAVGWGILADQPVAHAEGGSGIVTTPAVTYVISEIGLLMIFGPGAILLGVALLVFASASGATLPTWLRWLTVLAGIAALAAPAFFPAFLLLLWTIVFGGWLLAGGRRSDATAREPGV